MSLDVSLKHTEYMFFCKKKCIFLYLIKKKSPAIVQYPIVLASSGLIVHQHPADVKFSIGIYILPSYIFICFLHAAIYFVHWALPLKILFYKCACCDTLCFKNVCLFLFVEVKALLGLCYMLYNFRGRVETNVVRTCDPTPLL